ncbi:AIPR family protein, partial [bacterium]|nr:AIPR family protein [bacterium]
LMPAGDSGLATKWFYERARGQYSTALRGLKGAQKKKFEAEYPKRQLFNKTDMAKFENTWRMSPHIVKKGAQSNLKVLGAKIIKEYENDSEAFGAAFFKDLVAKAILFRGVDSAILQADWYKEDRGLKAEMVTYGIALLRHSLIARNQDIDLSLIYKRQSVSPTLLATTIMLARRVRDHVTDLEFTGGVANPSEFCKSEKGWKKIQGVAVDLDSLEPSDVLSARQSAEARKDKLELDKASKAISALDYVMEVTALEWDAIAAYNLQRFPMRHRNVGIPEKCASFRLTGDIPSDKQMKLAKEIREEAYRSGFDFIGA